MISSDCDFLDEILIDESQQASSIFNQLKDAPLPQISGNSVSELLSIAERYHSSREVYSVQSNLDLTQQPQNAFDFRQESNRKCRNMAYCQTATEENCFHSSSRHQDFVHTNGGVFFTDQSQSLPEIPHHESTSCIRDYQRSYGDHTQHKFLSSAIQARNIPFSHQTPPSLTTHCSAGTNSVVSVKLNRRWGSGPNNDCQ